MNRFAIYIALSGALLSGCSTPMVWNKPGATQQDFAKDSYECERDMRQSGYYGSGLLGALNANGFEDRCMQARGWYLQSASQSLGPTPAQRQETRYSAESAVQRGDCKSARNIAFSSGDTDLAHEIYIKCPG